MNLDLTDGQRLIQQKARDFAAREIEPRAAELDRTSRWPTEIVAQLGELGFMGLTVPSEHGGAGLDTVSYALVVEEISRACASCGVILSVNNSLFCEPLTAHGTEWQKRELLNPTAAGSILGAAAVTEPTGGFEVHPVRVVGDCQENGGYLVNGSVSFIPVGPEAEHVIVFAVTTPHPESPEHTALIVKRGTPGLSISPRDEKLGLHAAHSCAIHLENVRVPKEYVLGGEGAGLRIARSIRDSSRIGVAALAIGIARAAHEKAVTFAKESRPFTKPLADLQAIQFLIADMATELDAARLLTAHAAKLKDRGFPHSAEGATAKLFASEMATRVTHKALQIHGNYGYTNEYGVERHYRDARITEVYEGTSEIQRVVIAAGMLNT